METAVTQFRSILLMLVLGTLGAVLSASILLVTDGAPQGYGELIAKDLPVLIVAAGMGFGTGLLAAYLWSVLLRLFAAHLPRA
jgi:hypothetical protein